MSASATPCGQESEPLDQPFSGLCSSKRPSLPPRPSGSQLSLLESCGSNSPTAHSSEQILTQHPAPNSDPCPSSPKRAQSSLMQDFLLLTVRHIGFAEVPDGRCSGVCCLSLMWVVLRRIRCSSDQFFCVGYLVLVSDRQRRSITAQQVSQVHRGYATETPSMRITGAENMGSANPYGQADPVFFRCGHRIRCLRVIRTGYGVAGTTAPQTPASVHRQAARWQ